MRNDAVTVSRLLQRFGDDAQSVIVDEPLLMSDNFGAANHLAGAGLDDMHVIDGVLVGIDGAGVEPDITISEGHDLELASLEVLFVDGSNLQLATLTWFDALGDVDHFVVVEVEPNDSVVRLGGLRLLFNRDGLHALIELDHSVAFRVGDVIGEYNSSIRIDARFECLAKVWAVEEVIPQYQRYLVISDELLSDNEGLR